MQISGKILLQPKTVIQQQSFYIREKVRHITQKIKQTPKKKILDWLYRYIKGKLSA